MIQSKGFSVSAIGLGLVSVTLAQNFAQLGDPSSARSVILLGLPGALALSAASLLFYAIAQRYDLFSAKTWTGRLVSAGFLVWFGVELAGTVLQAQAVCRQQFASNALIGLLPLLVLLSWRMESHAINYTARILWWMLLVGGVACLLGLGEWMHWQRLFGPEPVSLWEVGLPQLRLYPEYFALAILCTKGKERSGALLPLWCFGVQAGYVLALELVLSRMRSPEYTGIELLRAWGMGYFSRLDALLVLFWLATALFRICFLICCLRLLWREGLGFQSVQTGKEGTA